MKSKIAIAFAVLAGVFAPSAMAGNALPPGTEQLAQQYNISIEQAAHNLEVQYQAGDISSRLKKSFGAAYAGVWFEAGRGIWHVNRTPGQTDAEVLKVAALDSDVAVDIVPHTISTINSAVAKINKVAGTTGVAIEPSWTNDKIEVFVSPKTAIVAGSTLQQAADDSSVATTVTVQEGLQDPEALSCSFPFCSAPFRGGLEIYSSPLPGGGVGACTSGFNTIDTSSRQMLLTAGHCFIGDPTLTMHSWKTQQPNGTECKLGAHWAHQWGAPGDWGLINRASLSPTCSSSNNGWIAAWTANEQYQIPSAINVAIGVFECHYGFMSVAQCGTVLNNNHTRTYSGVATGHIDELCASAIAGDSGGPTAYGGATSGYGTGLAVAGSGAWPKCNPSAPDTLGPVTLVSELSYILSSAHVLLYPPV